VLSLHYLNNRSENANFFYLPIFKSEAPLPKKLFLGTKNIGRHSLLLELESYTYARSHCCKFKNDAKHSVTNGRTGAIKIIVQKGSAIKIIVQDTYDIKTNSTSKNKSFEKVCIKHIRKNREENFILVLHHNCSRY